jgi:hypothetical protein
MYCIISLSLIDVTEIIYPGPYLATGIQYFARVKEPRFFFI